MLWGRGMGDTRIGALLSRLRTARGWTQQRVADEYNLLEGRATKTGKEIGRYEREARIPVPYTRKYLARVFGVDVETLDRAVAVSKSFRGEGNNVPECLPERPKLPVVPSRPGVGAVSADALTSADFARFIAQRNADEFVVEQLEADVARFARAYVSHPLLELYVEIKRLRDAAIELLRGRQHPRQTADLYVAASRLCGLSAHVCLDLGDYDSAATHARTARACAEAAGHEGMLAWVRAVESLIAYWTGRYGQAARLAQAGRHHRACGSIGARLASLEARALAIVGDRVGAVAALADAERSREAMSGDDEVPGIFAFPTAKQFAYAGSQPGPGRARTHPASHRQRGHRDSALPQCRGRRSVGRGPVRRPCRSRTRPSPRGRVGRHRGDTRIRPRRPAGTPVGQHRSPAHRSGPGAEWNAGTGGAVQAAGSSRTTPVHGSPCGFPALTASKVWVVPPVNSYGAADMTELSAAHEAAVTDQDVSLEAPTTPTGTWPRQLLQLASAPLNGHRAGAAWVSPAAW
ncbi:helix-turn-helix transcriptional regulator [Streptomyces hirsutus]